LKQLCGLLNLLINSKFNVKETMKISRAYKVEIKPNNIQKTFFSKSFGIARFAYNWGLGLSIKRHEQGEKYLGSIGLHKELCKIKKTEYPFMYEISKQVPQNALRDLDKSFKNFFRGLNGPQRVGFPVFKHKKKTKQSFRIDGNTIKISDSHIKLPKMKEIKLKENNYIPTINAKYINATISKSIDRWFVSVLVDHDESVDGKQIEEIVGIDVGIKQLTTCSNGDVVYNPKFINRYEHRLKRSQQSLSKKKKGSFNREKQVVKVAKIHRKIKASRLDGIHKMTSSITKTKCRAIVLEDLDIKGMMKDSKFAKLIADSSWFEIKRQLKYKTLFYGGKVFTIDRFFPSSKMCSNCNTIKDDLKLSDRIYNCTCGFSMDRDLNASINIQNYYTASSAEFKALGENVRLGSDSLVAQSNLCELGTKHKSLAC